MDSLEPCIRRANIAVDELIARPERTRSAVVMFGERSERRSQVV